MLDVRFGAAKYVQALRSLLDVVGRQDHCHHWGRIDRSPTKYEGTCHISKLRAIYFEFLTGQESDMGKKRPASGLCDRRSDAGLAGCGGGGGGFAPSATVAISPKLTAVVVTSQTQQFNATVTCNVSNLSVHMECG